MSDLTSLHNPAFKVAGISILYFFGVSKIYHVAAQGLIGST